MSMRDSISNAITLSQLNWEEPPTADEIADAILALPEMQEMRALWERHQRINELKKAWPTDDKYFAEQIQEWKEKAKKCDEHFKAIVEMEQEITELKEKAEKWDKWDKVSNNPIANLDLIMENLKAREKCPECRTYKDSLISDGFVADPVEFGARMTCLNCHGTGTITRPATPEEVNEFIEAMFGNIPFDVVHFRQYSEFKLKSGAVLFMGKE